MSREQIVRDTAYAIWEAEGKPTGRDALHWKQAEDRVAASLTAAPQSKPAAKAKTGAPKAASAAKAPAKAKPRKA